MDAQSRNSLCRFFKNNISNFILFVILILVINSKIDNVNSNVNSKIDNVMEVIYNMNSNVNSKIDNVNSNVNSRIENLDSNVNSKIDSMNSNVNSKIDSVNSSVNSKIDSVNSNVNSKIDSVNSSVNTKIDSVNSNVNSKIDSVNSKIDSVNSKIESLDSNVMEGFQELHDFGSRRAALLENISSDIVICNSSFTGHAVFLKGFFTVVAAKHFTPCENSETEWIKCENVDVAISRRCPETAIALDIDDSYELRLGDEVIGLGFASGAMQLWRGHLSRVVKEASGVVSAGEYFIEGSFQEFGMSGGALLNGCGYQGESHAVKSVAVSLYPGNGNATSLNVSHPFISNPSAAYAIPARLIKECISKHSGSLPTSCSKVTVASAPVLRSCNVLQYRKIQ
jgi:ElaB/YqjD/DUF883 family membrane-anchored ribosome-binding protein